MRYFLTIFAVLSALISVCTFLAFIWVFIAYLGGGFSILLPGLGLVIGAPLVLIVLFIVSVIMLSLAILLFRTIRKPLQ